MPTLDAVLLVLSVACNAVDLEAVLQYAGMLGPDMVKGRLGLV
jgi:hypothetical protein